MPKAKNPKNFATLSVSDVAELLGVTDRMVRNWIKDSALPSKGDPRGRLLDWPTTLKWYVAYRIEQNSGNGGSRKAQGPSEQPLETMEQALARRTRAEADLKELQLAEARGQVASIADVQRVLTASNKSIQTLLLSLPAALATRLIGLDNRAKIYNLLDAAIRSVLSNLASIDAVLEARKAQPDEEAE